MSAVRYTLHVPLVDNDGLDTPESVHAHIRGVLSRKPLPGGWTELDGTGGWRGQTEPVRLYIVDVATAPGANITRAAGIIHWLAETVKRDLAQEAVYVTRQTIESWLV